LKHVSETKIEKIDGLSRRLDWKVGVKNNNENKRRMDLKTSRSSNRRTRNRYNRKNKKG